MKIEKGLIIAEPWVTKTLFEGKVWDMRSTKTSFRGRFAIIAKGTGNLVGLASLVGVKGPLSNEELCAQFNNHQISQSIIEAPNFNWRYAWILSDVVAFTRPVPYTHKKGAVIWVGLDEAAQERLQESVHLTR